MCCVPTSLAQETGLALGAQAGQKKLTEVCLLYTSDAADERSSVDLGGRRIITKKKNNKGTKTEI